MSVASAASNAIRSAFVLLDAGFPAKFVVAFMRRRRLAIARRGDHEAWIDLGGEA